MYCPIICQHLSSCGGGAEGDHTKAYKNVKEKAPKLNFPHPINTYTKLLADSQVIALHTNLLVAK
jgi:hypothetical protein